MNIGLLILIVFLLIYVPVACVYIYFHSKMVDRDCSIFHLNFKKDMNANNP